MPLKPTSSRGDLGHAPARWLAAIVVVATLVAVTGGVLFYREQERSLREKAETELTAIAQLKIEQIASWREQHMKTAERLSSSRLFAENVQAWIDQPTPARESGIRQRLLAERPSGDYYDVILVDTRGDVLLRLDETGHSMHEGLPEIVREAVANGEPVLAALHDGPEGAPPHIDVIAPLAFEVNGERRSPGAVVLQSDLRDSLFPIVESWPTPSESAETVLVTRSGDDMKVINRRRHAAEGPSVLVPLTQTEHVAVQAVLGSRGIVEGSDYRGVPVVAHLAEVPGSGWFMVAKVDRIEAFAEWRSRAQLIVLLVVALLLGVASAVALVGQRARALSLRVRLADQQAHLEVEERLTSLFRAAPVGMGVTVGRVFVEVNDHLCEMLDRTREELVGASARIVYPDDNEFEQVGREFYGTIARFGIGDAATRFARPDGSSFDVFIRGAAIDPGNPTRGISFVAIDISDRIAAEADLRRYSALLEGLVAVSEVAAERAERVIGVAVRQAIRLTGSTACCVYERDPDTGAVELTGCAGSGEGDELDDSAPAGCALSTSSVIDDVVSRGVAVFVTPGEGGSPGSDGVLALPVIRAGRVVAVVSVAGKPGCYDDTDVQSLSLLFDGAWKTVERLSAEDEVRRVNESLERTVDLRTQELRVANEELRLIADELAEANEAKGRFLRSMSHELRTPLNSIIGFSDLMLAGMAGEISDEQRRQLEMVNHSGKHLLALISDILDLSRIEAGKMELRPELFTAAAAAHEALETVAPQADAKGLLLRFDCADDSPVVCADPVRVRQILLNLLSNAVKFTERGSVTLRLERSAPGMVGFAVVDTGPGIPEEDHDSIFGEFTQRHVRDSEPRDGTGLGLAISRGLAALLGGAITVDSAMGVGSTFTLLLPEPDVLPDAEPDTMGCETI